MMTTLRMIDRGEADIKAGRVRTAKDALPRVAKKNGVRLKR